MHFVDIKISESSSLAMITMTSVHLPYFERNTIHFFLHDLRYLKVECGPVEGLDVAV